jgi:hypothetical protein
MAGIAVFLTEAEARKAEDKCVKPAPNSASFLKELSWEFPARSAPVFGGTDRAPLRVFY